ncbi:hypothetical protein K443DRAFT_28125, partial [Laccaria amethystina LaAM-08-1]
MDIDRLTINEQNQYMKEGKCFRCGKTGHVQRRKPTGFLVRRLVTTSRPSKRLSIRSIRIRSVPGSDSKSMHVKTRIINGEKSVEIKALIDSGAQGNFMDEEFAKKHRIPIVRLKKEIKVSNVDESPNKSGPIRFETRLPTKIDVKTISTRYLISDI